MDIRLRYRSDIVASPIELPSSKSIANRALVINALSAHPAEIGGMSVCDDTQAIVGALEQVSEHSATIVDIGAAGTAMRFLTAYFAALEGVTVTLTGSQRMCRRPIALLVDALRQSGADIAYLGEEGFPPLRIEGKRLRGGEIAIRGDISSQYISALMMVGATFSEGLCIRLLGDTLSRPYIEMTAEMMRQWGIDVRTSADRIEILSHGYRSPASYTVEADWSAASYIYEMVALAELQNVVVRGLVAPERSLQGDSELVDLYRHFGVTTQFCDGCAVISCSPSESDEVLSLDLKATPDLVPAMVVTACLKGRRFAFEGVGNLRIKECDRIAVLTTEMRKLGYLLTFDDESVSWDGSRCESECNPLIMTYKDHRIAMAFAPAVTQHQGLAIEDAMVVNKSFPQYWEQMRLMGIIAEKI
ncbi:MAG: 3-phosphoshikimate 1-carboxyvinyltransferase [Muribaculaceae bacterium]|nr:3-phosphoshikimate 1-carboxyvinyltransferase [Muribaculaceae bacterium]